MNPNILDQMTGFMPKYCDRCGHKHDSTDLEVTTNDRGKLNYKQSCSNCGNVYVVQVNVMPDGNGYNAKKISFKTDITQGELERFAVLGPIDSNELIDVYDALNSVNDLDDLNKLMGVKKKVKKNPKN
jgi:hypothetical protein